MKYICLAIFVYIIAWLPYSILTIYAQFSSNAKEYVTPVTTSMAAVFAKTSCVLNPLLYSYNNREFITFVKTKILKVNVKPKNRLVLKRSFDVDDV